MAMTRQTGQNQGPSGLWRTCRGHGPVALLPSPRRGFAVRVGWFAVVLSGLGGAVSMCLGSPPQVIRVQVPAALAADWFPAGTAVRITTPERLESLLEGARQSAAGQRAIAEGPRLIRARHEARWQDDAILGRSELVVEAPRLGAEVLELEAWTPAVLSPTGGDWSAGSLSDGRTVLRLEPRAGGGELAIALDWILRARADSQGRSFTLGLPGDESSLLALEIPEGWVPVGPPGFRQGPLASERPGRSEWRFYGRIGRTELRLVDPRSGSDSQSWVSGPTRIQLDGPPGGDRWLANWETEWTVQLDPRGMKRFTALLDAGLELLEVTGPEVKEFQAERHGEQTRVQVVLTGSSAERSRVLFRAHARVPEEGRWSVPAIRPLDAVWTGGTTTIVVGPERLVEDFEERSGRSVPPLPGDALASGVFVFEARSAESVADLIFGPRRPGRPCLVRGRVAVTRVAPQLECYVSGIAAEGDPAELLIDLPPTWTPERVQWSGLDEPTVWHPTLLPDGSTRLRLQAPSGAAGGASATLILGATSAVAGGRGPLAMPRIRPHNRLIRDEVWVAMVDRGTALIPVTADGMVWIDPASVPGLVPPRPPLGPDLRAALAWRWTEAQGDLVVERLPADQDPRAELQYRVSVDPRGGLAILEGRITVRPAEAVADGLPVWFGPGAPALESWSFVDAASRRELRPEGLTDDARAAAGFPESGLAVRIPPGTAADLAERVIEIRAQLPWSGRGQVPLIWVPGKFLPRALLVLELPENVRTRVETSLVRRVEASWIDRASVPGPSSSESGAERLPSRAVNPVRQAYTYTEPGGSIELLTEELAMAEALDVVRDACLTSLIFPRGAHLNRLRLVVSSDRARILRLGFPPELRLLRVQVDGADFAPSLDAQGMYLNFAESSSTARARTIDLDYESVAPPLAPGIQLRTPLPAIELPCLSFCWEVIVPPHWRPGGWGADLTAHDLDPKPTWPFGWLSLASEEDEEARDAPLAPSSAALRRLDQQLQATGDEELTFAEWFTRWDAEDAPLVVDRTALAAAGFGPRSRCAPIRVDPRGQSAALKTLERYDLALVPSGFGNLITSTAEAARLRRSPGLRGALAEALLWGSDRSDRFQTIPRWRGEVTPGESRVAGRLIPASGWTAFRSFRGDWPATESWVRLVDARASSLPGWTLGLVCLFALAAPRRRPGRRQAVVPLLLMTIAVGGSLWLPEDYAPATAGLFAGSLGALSIRLGRSLRIRGSQRNGRRRSSSRSRQLRRAVGRLIGIVLALASTAVPQTDPEGPGDEPIVVLLPYDGAFDPGRPQQQAILRQQDYDRLETLARRKPSEPGLPVVALAASHRVTRVSQGEAEVTSEYVLRADHAAFSSWSFPVSRSREIRAWLNGRPAPLRIEEAGQEGIVWLGGAGTFSLRVQRNVVVEEARGFASMELPINPVAVARIVVDRTGSDERVSFPSARGKAEEGAGGTVAASLGPADRLEVLWGEPASDPPETLGGAVEGVLLWDIEPAGDRLRGRFTYRGSKRVSRLELGGDQGLIPRQVLIPGLVDFSRSHNSREPRWTARVDPPLEAGSSFFVEFWRPLQLSDEANTRENAAEMRRLPHLELIGIERYTGLLGVRRPAHWRGRLEPIAGTDPLSEEAFVKAWGALPDETLTLSGTTRFSRADRPAFETGPASSRGRVRSAVLLRMLPGRVEMELEAELSDLAGAVDRTSVELPKNLHVLEVDSEGIANWSRSETGLLRLRYDRAASPSRRKIQVKGWIPVVEDPLKLGTQTLRLRTPWPSWTNLDQTPGTLTIESPTPVSLRGATGISESAGPQAIESSKPGGSPVRRSYQVDDPRTTGELVWSSPPPRVNVLVESQLTLLPDSAEWVAVLRYDVLGGGLSTLHLKVPTPWASRAQLQLAGREVRPVVETRGSSTFWAITPPEPIWGSRRLVLRSSLPLPDGQELELPAITPLGWGVADTYLELVQAVAPPFWPVTTSGLRAIPVSNRFEAADFARFPGRNSTVYRVEREPWFLKIQLPAILREGGPAELSARLLSADVTIALRPDGSVQGRAVYDTAGRSGRFLAIELPRKGSLLRATVDNLLVSPLRSSAGTWLIPLQESVSNRVGIVWSERPQPADDAPSAWDVELPRAGLGRVPTLLAFRMAEPRAPRPAGASLAAITPERLELERANRSARRINELIGSIDRTAGRERERITGLLVSHEMHLRAVERSLRAASTRRDRGSRERIGREMQVVQGARRAMEEAIRAARLEPEYEAVLAYLGTSGQRSDSPPAAVPEPPSIDRIREFGHLAALLGSTPGVDEPPQRIRCVPTPPASFPDNPQRARLILLLGSLAALGLATFLMPDRRAIALLALFAVLGLAAVLGGVAVLGLVAALTLGGRLAGGSPASSRATSDLEPQWTSP